MDRIIVQSEKTLGRIKSMHAVNNGPNLPAVSGNGGSTNFEDYQWLRIPYARNHDANHCNNKTYGGPHTVDVHVIFPDFDADVNDPASYDFDNTDLYTKNILDAGTKVFYRLGASIEHQFKKYGTRKPKDYQKWAEVCKHIIRHYNDGWANGFYYHIEYWEIWNEPDLDPDDSLDKRCWSGTAEEFYELFCVTFRYLKKTFPRLTIGGPAISWMGRDAWIHGFLQRLADEKLCPDFVSWHKYFVDPDKAAQDAQKARKLLDQYGLAEAESILNEWNYTVAGGDFAESMKVISSLKGAAFTAATMLRLQNEPVDMLMYYDARPNTVYNGLFDRFMEKQKGYWPFLMFTNLYEAGIQTACEVTGQDLYAVSAKDERGKQSLMIAYYADHDGAVAKDVQITLDGAAKLNCYLLDATHNADKVGFFRSDDTIRMEPNTVYFLTEKELI